MRNRSALTILALATGLGLSACSGDTTAPAAATTPATSSSATASASPTTTPSASPKATEAPAQDDSSGAASAPEDSAPAGEQPVETAVAAPAPAPAPGAGGAMTDEEAYYAYRNGEITQAEYCSRPTFFAPEDAQQCFKFQYPDLEQMPGAGPRGWGDTPPQHQFTYDEAYAAWQSGMAYYDAFCLNYTPVTEAGISQCTGIRAGTVDGVTGEYIGG